VTTIIKEKWHQCTHYFCQADVHSTKCVNKSDNHINKKCDYRRRGLKHKCTFVCWYMAPLVSIIMQCCEYFSS